MIDQELRDYVKVLRLQNETNENAKSKLTALNKWTSQDIDQALQPINESLNQENSVQVNTEIPTNNPKKSLISKILFVSFCLLSVNFIIRFGSYITQLFVIFNPKNKLISPIFIKVHPWILIIPLILAFLTMFTIYSTLKIRVYSKKSWVLGLITLTIVPILFFISEMLIIYQYDIDASF